MNLNGLLTINIELTSRCNKNCWMCGRRKIDKDFPEISLNYGDIEFNLLEKISSQIPDGIIVQFHNNGEPMLYPRFIDALKLFKGKIRCFDTNGKLLDNDNIVSKFSGNLESFTVSTFQNDEEWKQQYDILMSYIEKYGNTNPTVIIRVLGEVGDERMKLYKNSKCLLAHRVLHSPMGSFDYNKHPTIPEHGFCLESLSHPAINRFGDVSMCVRFDPNKENIIGNINDNTLEEIWNGKIRKEIIKKHIEGNRKNINFCSKCEYWGIPRG